MSTPLRREVRRLSFEIGDNTYEVPPVDDDRGTKLADMLTGGAAAKKASGVDMYKLAMSPELWDRMRADDVGFVDLRTAGLAALVHFHVLLNSPNPAAALDRAEEAARSVWEAGVDPEALAATMAAQISPTKPSTPSAAASTTRSAASGTGTRSRQPAKKTTKAASRSRGGNLPRNAR